MGVIFASSSLQATGSVTPIALLAQSGVVDLIALSTISSFANQVYNVNFISGIETFTRTTEAGDRRVTEDGSVRITSDIPFNTGEGTIISFGDRVAFTAEPYVKVLSNWKLFTPYVKYEDNWQVPERIYKHTNGSWKRIF